MRIFFAILQFLVSIAPSIERLVDGVRRPKSPTTPDYPEYPRSSNVDNR